MLGVGVRTCFWFFENHRDIHFENTMHFGKLNMQNVGEWYFNQQLVFWHYSLERYKDIWAISLGLNLGKTIAFTKRLGLNIDAGLGINHILLTLVYENALYPPESHILLPLNINLSLGLAYKF
ncbi:MAG: DUF3575 domain-containing protein [Bacteroidota bacterium]|nr:DUF3575 domain-containing protein [Bacteroidota bacterium]